MKKKLALFDLDGTLFDTSDVNYYAYLEAVEKEGCTIDYDFYCRECNGRHYKYFLPLIGISDEGVQERIHTNKKNLYERYLARARVNQELFHMIEDLDHCYYKAVVTTASRKNTEQILKFFGKRECFDLLITQEDIQKPKPDPEGYLLAMRYFNVCAEDTIIFEDSEVGLKAAKTSGAKVIKVDMDHSVITEEFE